MVTRNWEGFASDGKPRDSQRLMRVLCTWMWMHMHVYTGTPRTLKAGTLPAVSPAGLRVDINDAFDNSFSLQLKASGLHLYPLPRTQIS